ncbi:MAG TPA: hypothetical protein VMT34_05890 [Aggregatilineales bacterium]|nr:hypothetical protein [Aggregatilineales bacterium]
MLFLAEARPFLPIDLPLVRRLTPHGVSLDTATSLTRGVHPIDGAVWSSVPLADFGMPTFVLRAGDRNYAAQFRHKFGEPNAHIVFVAPDLQRHADTSAWLQLLDTMVSAAGRRGALTLNAEVDDTSPVFEVLREAGFSLYTRQTIWRSEPGALAPGDATLLRPETDRDTFAIHALCAAVVPRMICQAGGLPDRGGGLVYERHEHLGAYLSIQEGKCGIYIQPFLRPEVFDRAGALLRSVWAILPHTDRVPVYVCIRRYQEWLQGTLTALDFQPWASQAVMVKHLTSRVEQSHWSRERARNFVLPVISDYYDACLLEKYKGVSKN